MGATVSTDKRVYAFLTQEKKAAYVLYEQTYEKNCYPHTPSWSAQALGYIEDVIPEIFRWASSCEGGLLQHRSGAVLPELYLQRWFEALAKPYHMPDRSFTLGYSNKFAATLPLAYREQIEASLRSCGLENAISTLDGRTVTLYSDFDLLRAIFGTRELALWRVFEGSAPQTEPAEGGLEWSWSASQKIQETTAPPPMYRVGDQHVVLANEKGDYTVAGWEYVVVGNFVKAYGATECLAPGSCKKAIQAYRLAVQQAPQLADHTAIKLDVAGEATRYGRERTQSVLDRFAPKSTQMQLTLGQVRAKEAEAETNRHLLNQLLGCSAAVWLPTMVT